MNNFKLNFLSATILIILTAANLDIVSAYSQSLSNDKDMLKDSFMNLSEPCEFMDPAHPAPEWLRGAIILEVPIRTFNHRHYDNTDLWKNPFGDASYLSIIEKLGFIKKLGINVICLYSVYHHTPETNLYAIYHHKPSPDLGTQEDVKTLIDKAHQMGIYVISNTNHYGVDQTSPMIDEYPDWFLSREENIYGQRVFDINNPEVVKYIIETHAWWCTEIGLDGWRIDVGHKTYRKYIWDAVLEKCFSKNKPILLATEGTQLDTHIRGAGRSIFPPWLDMENAQFAFNSPLIKDGFTFIETTADNPYLIKDISTHNSRVPYVENYNPETFPREGAYKIKGSRFLFGHNLLFAPIVPWMMVGELFNATHLPVPGIVGNRRQWKLLKSYLNWDNVEKQQDVINDFIRIVNIRKNNSDIFHNNLYETHLINVPFSSEPYSEVKPYVRFLPGKKAIVVIGNNDTEHDVVFNLEVPIEKLGFGNEEKLMVTDLWNDNEGIMSTKELLNYSIVVPKDKSPGGGVRAILVSKKMEQ